MALISKPFTWSAGATIIASEHNSNFDTIYNSHNGNISNANLISSAGIVDTKLAQITTASKVRLSAVVVASQAQGDIIYASDATTLTHLGAGTDGQFLKTQGAAANPVWATVSSGLVVQVVNTQTGAININLSTTIPDDNTIPQITEGNEVMTLAITPTSATNKLKIDVVVHVSGSSAVTTMACLFQDSTANALAVGYYVMSNSGTVKFISFTHYMTSGTTSATTFKVRVGAASGSVHFNGNGTNSKMGGTIASSITISEITV